MQSAHRRTVKVIKAKLANPSHYCAPFARIQFFCLADQFNCTRSNKRDELSDRMKLFHSVFSSVIRQGEREFIDGDKSLTSLRMGSEGRRRAFFAFEAL